MSAGSTNAAPLLSGDTITVGFENQTYIANLFTVVSNNSNKNPCGSSSISTLNPFQCIVYGDTGSCTNAVAALVADAPSYKSTTNFVIKALTFNSSTSSYDFMADGTAIQYGMYIGIYQVINSTYFAWHVDIGASIGNTLTLLDKSTTTYDGKNTDIRYQVWVLADPDNATADPANSKTTHYQGIYDSATNYVTYPYTSNKSVLYGSSCIFQSVGKRDISNTSDYYFIDNQNQCKLTVDNFNNNTHQVYHSLSDILTFFVILNENGLITNNDGTTSIAPNGSYYESGGLGTQSLTNLNSTSKPAGYTPSNNNTGGSVPNLQASDQLKYDNHSSSTADTMKEGLFIYVIIVIVILALLLLYHIYSTAKYSNQKKQIKQMKEVNSINKKSHFL